MLGALWNLLDDDSDTESRLLADLLRKYPELPEWSSAMRRVLDPLLASNPMPRPVVCRVLSGMPPNALALPYKTIVVAESMVEFCREHTHQMAFVVAHELAHIYRGHARERSRAGTLAGMLAPNPLVGMGVKVLLDRGCSRESEFEADRDAVAFCSRAGFAVEGGAEFLNRLARGERPTGGLQQLLSTHPPLAERLAEVQAAISRLPERSPE